MRKLTAFLLLLTFPGFAVAATNNVTASTVLKVDGAAGNDANGAGWDAASAGGTGVDQTTNSPIVVTGVTCTGSSSTTITATGSPWTNVVVGNAIQIASGTNFTAGWYTILTFTDANNLVLNISPCTGAAATAGSTRIGGPLLTVTKATGAVVAGNTVYVKASATYSISAGIAMAANGSSGHPISWIGYTSSLTDGGQPLVQVSSGSSLTLFNGNGKTFQQVKNFTFDCNAKTSTTGMGLTTNWTVQNIVVKGCTATSFNVSGGHSVISNSVASGQSACTASSGAITVSTTNVALFNNRATANACPGFWDSGGGENMYVGNISDNNTGASSHGFYKSGNTGAFWHGNVAYLNGGDQFKFDNAAALDNFYFSNNVAWGTSGTCFNSTTTNWAAAPAMAINNNAVGGGCTARADFPTGTNDQPLTVDPFVAGGSNNFAPNSTAGGGALLRAMGFPGVLNSGGSGYRDIGAVQSTPAVSAPISQ